ncbi:MAG TPA: hypothetical protein ENI95_14300 [Chloroflexi bacterium]|nr:hypothetical protein [Chloroflexota bacterium]
MLSLPIRKAFIVALFAALGSGVAIGVQSTLTSRSGQLIGPVRAGLLINLAGGTLSGVILLFLIARQGLDQWRMSAPQAAIVLAAGGVGILIVSGLAYSLQRTGVAAGLASIIVGQMIVAVVVDTIGLGGLEPIPLSLRRIAGLLMIGVAIALLLPRGS